MIDTELKIWTAGMFDGEGSALIERIGSKRSSFQIVVAVSSTDPRNTDPIREVWGGHYRANRDTSRFYKDGSKRRLDHSVYFNRDEALVFLTDIFPYLRSKREETVVVIQAIQAQTSRIEEIGLRGHSYILEPYYTRLQHIRNSR